MLSDSCGLLETLATVVCRHNAFKGRLLSDGSPVQASRAHLAHNVACPLPLFSVAFTHAQTRLTFRSSGDSQPQPSRRTYPSAHSHPAPGPAHPGEPSCRNLEPPPPAPRFPLPTKSPPPSRRRLLTECPLVGIKGRAEVLPRPPQAPTFQHDLVWDKPGQHVWVKLDRFQFRVTAALAAVAAVAA